VKQKIKKEVGFTPSETIYTYIHLLSVFFQDDVLIQKIKEVGKQKIKIEVGCF